MVQPGLAARPDPSHWALVELKGPVIVLPQICAESTLAAMVVFGKWSLWAVIILTTIAIAVSIAAAGHLVIAAALVAVVVVGAIYQLRDSTNL
ncbi:MAG TPA: hypothetical protein VKA41_02515 [Solirubrobacterales bacterium]|nr:hypothetical protein [Solirubrobacterales bacterium]